MYHWLLTVTVAREVPHVPALPAHSTWPPTQHRGNVYQPLELRHPTSMVDSIIGENSSDMGNWYYSVKGMYMHNIHYKKTVHWPLAALSMPTFSATA